MNRDQAIIHHERRLRFANVQVTWHVVIPEECKHKYDRDRVCIAGCSMSQIEVEANKIVSLYHNNW